MAQQPMAQQPMVSAMRGKVGHPMLKGFGVSMLVSILYARLIVFGPIYGTSELLFTVASFPAVFILVNGLIALHYQKHYLIGVKSYIYGAVLAFILDLFFLGGLYWLLLIFLF